MLFLWMLVVSGVVCNLTDLFLGHFIRLMSSSLMLFCFGLVVLLLL